MAETLQSIAKAMVADGKGLLAADESTTTIQRRFDAIGVENTEPNRRAYRELLFTTPGVEKYISGVILFDETIRQSTADGTPFPQLLKSKGIIPGIKVDKGVKQLPNSKGETYTEGMDGLRERLKEYYGLGARFAKWRAVIDIADGIPTDYAIHINAVQLAQYASLCQAENIVPIVEPEVLMDGGHNIETCFAVTKRVLLAVFAQLALQRVQLDGMILKPNFVIDGQKSGTKSSAQKIAQLTVQCFKETVPAAVPGIVFLSGGQGEVEATVNLQAANALGPLPWALSYSYGRALQASTQKAWSGKTENVDKAKTVYAHRAHMNTLAALGKYTAEAESGR
jgi:fructose-bisphosphate aldolase class I